MEGSDAIRKKTKRADNRQVVSPPSGGKCHQERVPNQRGLLFTVMPSYINLLATDHSKMASDKDRFTSSILAVIAKALLIANYNLEVVQHKLYSSIVLRAESGLSTLHRPLDNKTGLELYKFLPCYFN